MKKILLILLSLTLAAICTATLADVKIDETNFPDENFRVIVQGFDTDEDGALNKEEIDAVSSIDCLEQPIKTIEGIEFFPALTKLSCARTSLTKLDIRRNKALEVLDCSEIASLEKLDISKNAALKELKCSGNKLTKLDVHKNQALVTLDCSGNRLTKLDVRKNEALTCLSCAENKIKKLDVCKNASLKLLRCYSNQLSKLDISKVPALNDLVKNNEPAEAAETLAWTLPDSSAVLVVDKNVKVVTSTAETIEIGNAAISAIKAKVYKGKALEPAVTVKYNGKKLTRGKDYTAAYADNKEIGTATVTLTGIGKFSGTAVTTFDIIPKAVNITSVSAKDNQLTVKWKKGSNITGYEIEYSLKKKDFSDSAKVTVSDAETTKLVLKDLIAKKTYYIRIRCYKTVNDKYYYSAWSSAKQKKIK